MNTTAQALERFDDQRELLGKIVRMEWMAWAREQPNPKPSWLLSWTELSEPEREVDRRIGERIYRMAIDGLLWRTQRMTPETAQALERLESDIRALADTAPPYEDRMFEWADQLSALRALYTHPQPAVVSDEMVVVERKLLMEVLKRDSFDGDCRCIRYNRRSEQEYESGTCPHQRLRAALTEGGSRE